MRAFIPGSIAFFSVFYSILACICFLWESPEGFKVTLIKRMEDPEFYYFPLLFKLDAGKSLLSFTQDIFGFYAIDAILFAYWIIVAVACSSLFVKFAWNGVSKDSWLGQRLSHDKKKALYWMICFVGIAFILLSRKFFNIASHLSLQRWSDLGHHLEFARSLFRPYDSWFTRFFNPGFPLFALLLGLTQIESLKERSPRKSAVKYLNPTLLILAAFFVCESPFVALALCSFLGFEFLFALRNKNRLGALSFAAAIWIIVAFSLLSSKTNHPDFLERMSIEYTRMPDVPLLTANILLLLLALALCRARIGRTVALLQLSNCFALSSCAVLGYSILPWHFMYVPIVTVPLLICAVLAKAFSIKTIQWRWLKKRGVQAAALLILFLWGLREQMALSPKYRDYYMTPATEIEAVERARKECGPGKRYSHFFTRNVSLYWSAPGRSLCENVVLNGQDPKLSNSKIAARYLAAMLHFRVYPSREVFLQDLENHLKHLSGGDRELVRNHVKYPDRDRIYHHTLWYLFVMGFNNRPSMAMPYLRELFKTVDCKEELRFLQELEARGRVLRI